MLNFYIKVIINFKLYVYPSHLSSPEIQADENFEIQVVKSKKSLVTFTFYVAFFI